MDNYRFRLQKYVPNNKVKCPGCGRKRCAVKYIDVLGIIEFPDEVCLCDHVHSCGYHYPPREYFRDHPEVAEKLKEEYKAEHSSYHANGYNTHLSAGNNANQFKTRNTPIPLIAAEKNRPFDYIDDEIVRKSMAMYSINPLYRFLSSKFGEEETHRIFCMYNVGTSKMWNGSTLFWYQDIDGNYNSGKVMGYNVRDGHRIKEPRNLITWAHSLLNLPDFNRKSCLFGEHLLSLYPKRQVVLVEAEKTCLIASHFLPDYIWLATGGLKMGFNEGVLKVLEGREVTLYPDLGGFEEWKKHMPLLESICKKVTVSHFLEEHATDEQKKKGLDVGDFLLMNETNREILSQMIARTPSIKTLMERLKLELVDDEEE